MSRYNTDNFTGRHIQQSSEQTVRKAGLLVQHTPCGYLGFPVYVQPLEWDIGDSGMSHVLKLLKQSDLFPTSFTKHGVLFPGHDPWHLTPQL